MNSTGKANPDQLHQQLQDCSGRLMPALYSFFRNGSAPDAMSQAWKAFTCDHPLTMDEEQQSEVEELFFPWLFFNWKPEGQKLSVAEQFLSSFAEKTERLSRELILAGCKEGFAYYQVTEVTAGSSIQLKQLATGKKLLVREQVLSMQIASEGILFARLVEIRGELFIFGCAPWILPESHAQELTDLGTSDLQILLTRYFDIRQTVFQQMEKQADEMVDAILQQSPIEETLQAQVPSLEAKATEKNVKADQTTAGLQVWKLECSVPEAYDALKTLAGRNPSDELLLSDASYDSNGVLLSFSIPWLEKQQTLAELIVSNDRLSVRCSPEQRDPVARRIRRRLGKKVSLLGD